MTRSLLALSVLAAAALPAQDDRDRSTPVASIWLTNQTPTDLQNVANAGWRFTDIEIEATSPWEFTVSAVANTGSYQKGWLYFYGVTGAQLSTAITQNNARIVDLEPYDDNGTTRFAAILIGNSGADAKTWWWLWGATSAQVDSAVTANNARLTTFRRYTIGGQTRYAAVMISNTGADFRNWGYLYGASSATLDQNIAQNGNRIYGIERIGTDAYDVILMQANLGWWYYYDQTAAAVTELLQQNIGRLIDVERHATLLGTRFNVVLVDNANALEQTARAAFQTAASGALGDHGFFLKEMNGPVLAEMRADTVFEPASTMKTLYHVHAMRQVWLGSATLGMTIQKPFSCGGATTPILLSNCLRQMMEQSDNMSTLGVSNWFGIGNIENTAAALGMTSTDIQFTIGCAGPTPGSIENRMTLRDLSRLHEQVANGYLGAQRANFYDLMLEDLTFPSWGTVDLSTRINSEAATLGLPNAVRDAFKNALHIAYKPGGIGINVGTQHYYFAEGGWMSVPFKNALGAITPREYTFGVFNYDFATQEVSGRDAMSLAELEIVWDRVRAALATWDNYVPGQVVPLVGLGCAGSNGTPSHTATGTPDIGSSVTYSLGNAPSQTLCLALFGFDNIAWNGVQLPIDLAPVGAPGCVLRINPVVLDPGLTTLLGSRAFPVAFPNNPSLIGTQLFSQYLVFDPPANAFDWTITRALRTTIGGWL